MDDLVEGQDECFGDLTETVVSLANGMSLRSGLYDESRAGLSCGEYVRLCDSDGNELLYWDQEEWQRDPALVMGAILNAACGETLQPKATLH